MLVCVFLERQMGWVQEKEGVKRRRRKPGQGKKSKKEVDRSLNRIMLQFCPEQCQLTLLVYKLNQSK